MDRVDCRDFTGLNQHFGDKIMFGGLKQARREKRRKMMRDESVRQCAAILSAQFRNLALNSTRPGVTETRRPTPLIVSLTTFNKRIEDVYLTIESLFQQSTKADRILLWVSREEFTEQDIPAILRLQSKRGLEIAFCDRDLGPYKKFYYTLRENPNSLILTVDDDVLYPVDMIDQLLRAHRKSPEVIHCHRAHKMAIGPDGNLLPYQCWEHRTTDTTPSKLIFPTGVGGVLYFPGCFDEEVLNEKAFMALAPAADDIWLKAMTLKNDVLCQRVCDSRDWRARYLPIEGSQAHCLKRQNKKSSNGNDAQMHAVFSTYSLMKHLPDSTD